MVKYSPTIISLLFLISCNNSVITPNTNKDGKVTQNNPAPSFGSGFKTDCVTLTQDIEKDLKSVNPDNKDNLSKEDLGVGTDSYLDYRFNSNDKDKNSKLDINELKNYLGNTNQATLGGFCRKP
mgnify:CR=1 FL=1